MFDDMPQRKHQKERLEVSISTYNSDQHHRDLHQLR